MPKTTTQWIKALIAAFISGATTSLLNVMGVSGANMAGAKVEQFSTKQIVTMTLVGGVIGAALYLKQSPVPPDNTTPPTQPKP